MDLFQLALQIVQEKIPGDPLGLVIDPGLFLGAVIPKVLMAVDSHHAAQSRLIMALITPVSGLVYEGKWLINSSKLDRCVIHGLVSIFPSSISWMIRSKSCGKALRLA